MTPKAQKLMNRVATWPEDDLAELEELAREIEARRSGVYVMSDEERSAVEESRRGRIVSDEEMAPFWKRFGVV